MMNQANSMSGGGRANSGSTAQSGEFDGQHTYVIQENRRESQDEELDGAGTVFEKLGKGAPPR